MKQKSYISNYKHNKYYTFNSRIQASSRITTLLILTTRITGTFIMKLRTFLE